MNRRLLVLDDEVFEATSVLRHVLAVLADHRFAITDGPAVMSLLALGVEKWSKLTLGLLAEADGRGWPSTKSMRAWGHDVPRLEAATRDQLRNRVALSVAPGHAMSQLEELDRDETLDDVLAALGRYAARDAVATRLNLWERLTGADADSAMRDINQAMVASVQRWWDWYRLCWVQGMCGPDARALGRPLA